MVRTAWRTAISGFLLLLATCSEGSAAYVGDRYFPSTLATTVPTPADFYNPPYFVKLPDTATTREFSDHVNAVVAHLAAHIGLEPAMMRVMERLQIVLQDALEGGRPDDMAGALMPKA